MEDHVIVAGKEYFSFRNNDISLFKSNVAGLVAEQYSVERAEQLEMKKKQVR